MKVEFTRPVPGQRATAARAITVKEGPDPVSHPTDRTKDQLYTVGGVVGQQHSVTLMVGQLIRITEDGIVINEHGVPVAQLWKEKD